MGTDEQVVFVLELTVAVGPLAVYFLALGLLNSRPCPYLIGLRADFSFLSIAFFPVLMVPLAALAVHGRFGFWMVGLAAVVPAIWGGVRYRIGAGWVIYNVDERGCREAVIRACRRIGWEVTGEPDRLQVVSPRLELRLSAFSLLRNVTLRIAAEEDRDTALVAERLGEALERELNTEALLPSPTGAGLVLVGSALLAMPMWYLFHHMEAVVDVVRRVFLA